MTTTTGTPHERREHARIIAKGAVNLRTFDHAQGGRIVNLSAGGLSVVTSVNPPERLLRRSVELEIRLDGIHAEWVSARGEIVRIRALGLAIAFHTPHVELLAMIDRLGTAAHASARVITVVLIDADRDRRGAMAAGFRATGCTVVEAATPLEAVVRLGETSFEPDVIAVADSQCGAAEEMRGFVEREHPRAKLVTISDAVFAPDGIAHWLSSTASYVDLPGRIRSVLLAARGEAAT